MLVVVVFVVLFSVLVLVLFFGTAAPSVREAGREAGRQSAGFLVVKGKDNAGHPWERQQLGSADGSVVRLGAGAGAVALHGKGGCCVDVRCPSRSRSRGRHRCRFDGIGWDGMRVFL